MNAEIKTASDLVLAIYQAQRTVLETKPLRELEDLKHECDDLRLHEDFSIRTAAEINRAACVLILEGRRK